MPVDGEHVCEVGRVTSFPRLFPPGCTCLSYGHGLTMTRVTSASCPVHGRVRPEVDTSPSALAKLTTAELEARVDEWVRNG